ncbi:hypothetical protein SAMN05216420_105182 [Nitrosospira sp. Nl5]|nr:hypothetical protein SAMN05216420_105182 [Nitrosospira sp. Nl5]
MRQILRARIPASYAYGIGNIAWGGILIDILFRSKYLRGHFLFMAGALPPAGQKADILYFQGIIGFVFVMPAFQEGRSVMAATRTRMIPGIESQKPARSNE